MHWLLSGSLSIETLSITIQDLPTSLQGTTIVHLSDFHYDGLRLSEELLEQAIAVTNQAEPDLIVLTGDYITDDPSPIHPLVLRLKHLHSRLGVYAVLGNHDNCCRGARTIVRSALTRIGIQVLWNEIAYPFGRKLPLVGLADFWSREFRPASVMNQLDPQTPRIVLSHNPDTAEILQRWRVDLQLSGHTHGGQIVLPQLGPVLRYGDALQFQLYQTARRWFPSLPSYQAKVIRHWEWVSGLHAVGRNQLYVNRGLGTYLPGRLFCSPEVSVLTLNKAL